jgi:hypothetical protein
MPATSRELRLEAERLFTKAASRWSSRQRSRRLYHRAIDYQHAARLAERREREVRALAYDLVHGRLS